MASEQILLQEIRPELPQEIWLCRDRRSSIIWILLRRQLRSQNLNLILRRHVLRVSLYLHHLLRESHSGWNCDSRRNYEWTSEGEQKAIASMGDGAGLSVIKSQHMIVCVNT